jgi:hypothetical protein
MAHLVETGKLTLEDVHDAEKLLRELSGKTGSEVARERGSEKARGGQ